MIRLWRLAAIALMVSGCNKPPELAQPPASEYTVTPLELAAPSLDTIQGAAISPRFLSIIGVSPLIGRLFIQNDFQPTGTPTAVISYDLWQRRFGSDPRILGKPIRLNGADAIVVGVTPRGLDFPKGTSIWIPRPDRT